MFNQEDFSLQIGSLEFNKNALGYILFGLFFIVLLIGIVSMLHIQNAATPLAATLSLYLSVVIPIYFMVKGFRKATVKEQQQEKVVASQPSRT